MTCTYYTYFLCRPDGRVFYVGLGHGGRAFKDYDRNDHCLKVIAKIRKEGGEVFRLLHFVHSLEEAQKSEIEHISFFGREDLGTGELTNKTGGGEGSIEPSPETRRRMGAANVGRANPHLTKLNKQRRGHKINTGRAMHPNTRAAIAASHRGRKHKPETIEKMRISAKNRRPRR